MEEFGLGELGGEKKLDVSEKTIERKLSYMVHIHKKGRLIPLLETWKDGRKLFWDDRIGYLEGLYKQITFLPTRVLNEREEEVVYLLELAYKNDK